MRKRHSQESSEKETDAILADKKLMKAIKDGEKELNEGKGRNWKAVKKELFK
jgi:hypothetical protein